MTEQEHALLKEGADLVRQLKERVEHATETVATINALLEELRDQFVKFEMVVCKRLRLRHSEATTDQLRTLMMKEIPALNSMHRFYVCEEATLELPDCHHFIRLFGTKREETTP